MAKAKAETSDAGSVMLIGKIAAILGAMSEHGEVNVARLAELTGEPRSSLYRLLQSLQIHGYVEGGSRRGTYRLGLQLLRLGTAVADQFDVRRNAQPVMQELHDSTSETVFLCVRQGDEAVCIERIDGREVQILALQVGGRLPLHAGAVSRALLAFAPEAEWEEYWRRAAGGLVSFTAHTPTTKRVLLDELASTRRTGMAVSDEDVSVGIAALGAPIFDHRDEVCASLSIGGVRAKILGDRRQEVEALVREAASKISHSMGHRAEDAAAGASEAPRPR